MVKNLKPRLKLKTQKKTLKYYYKIKTAEKKKNMLIRISYTKTAPHRPKLNLKS